MDRMNYTFNGCGEFMFLDGNSSQLQIQVRFTRATGTGLGTVISAVVIKQEPFDPIQINLKSGGIYIHTNKSSNFRLHHFFENILYSKNA